MALPQNIHTYHCICTSLLLASTHALSTLPTRSTTTSPTSSPDIILPLPPSPPSLQDSEEMPPEGYSMLLGMAPEKKVTIVRREDGFEKRILWRCDRCRLGVGYELQTQLGEAMEVDGGQEGGGKGKGKEGEDYEGKVIYLLPGGIMSTDVMMGRKGKRVGEGDVGIKRGGVGVFE